MMLKGLFFLYVCRELQDRLDLFIVSWGYDVVFFFYSCFLDYYQFNGIRDFLVYFIIFVVISYLEKYNDEGERKWCCELVKVNILCFCELLGMELLVLVSDDFFGQMVFFFVQVENVVLFNFWFYNEFCIEIFVMLYGDCIFIWYFVVVFNMQEDLDILYCVLEIIRNDIFGLLIS